MPTLRSPERPPPPHTTSQIQKGLNYHINLGLLYIDHLTDPQYDPPYTPHVFQSIQQNLIMEGHHPYHYLFNQILLQRLWKNMNQ